MGLPPFRDGPNKANSLLDIVGPIAEWGCAQIHNANINTSVQTVTKNMQHYHVQNLPTPINPNKLEIFLKDYDQNSRSMLSKGIKEGFLIQSNFYNFERVVAPNHRSARDNPDIVEAKLDKEIHKGRIKGPFDVRPFKNFVCSPLGLVSKKEAGQFRLIHDLSYPRVNLVNSCIPPEFTAVQYQKH